MEAKGIEEVKKKAKRKVRSENWLEDDKILLKNLVKERVSVLENKNTDTDTNSRKVDAWVDLKNSFNCMCRGVQRSVGQLRTKWGQIKMKKKKQNAMERRKMLRPGGGPQSASTGDNWDDNNCVWLPNETDPTVESNEFDSNQETIGIWDATAAPKLVKGPKKIKKTISPAEQIAAVEIECRKELHRAQMQNELLKKQNLEAEKRLLQFKEDYYKQQLNKY